MKILYIGVINHENKNQLNVSIVFARLRNT